MRSSLAEWIRDADRAKQIDLIGVAQPRLKLSYIQSRAEDFYLALLGELYDRLRQNFEDSSHWARLGNALAQHGLQDFSGVSTSRINSVSKPILFAAAAFYFGGFPASSFVILKNRKYMGESSEWLACFDLLSRPNEISSPVVQDLIEALRSGRESDIEAIYEIILSVMEDSLSHGPDKYIPLRLLAALVQRFRRTNLRAVLPDGSSEFWSPFVSSLLDRSPSCWEFFPSQIEAIRAGLFETKEPSSLQMPTGTGKTALMEALLFHHSQKNENDASLLLVPYRSLASELKSSLVPQLNQMGIVASCMYGGTVPLASEVRSLEDTKALITTPETLSALLTTAPAFLDRVSLVICDEGHLLDEPSRGVSLELLLARLKTRHVDAPKFVFISAIVPNVEEINAWLGGSEGIVVRSDYRPAIAEFAFLTPVLTKGVRSISRDMNQSCV